MNWKEGVAAASRRAVVLLPDGRTGRLFYFPVPIDERRVLTRHRGMRARVLLHEDAVVSVAPEDVRLLEVFDESDHDPAA